MHLHRAGGRGGSACTVQLRFNLHCGRGRERQPPRKSTCLKEKQKSATFTKQTQRLAWLCRSRPALDAISSTRSARLPGRAWHKSRMTGMNSFMVTSPLRLLSQLEMLSNLNQTEAALFLCISLSIPPLRALSLSLSLSLIPRPYYVQN